MKLLNVSKFKEGDVIEHIRHPEWERTVLLVGSFKGWYGYYELKMDSGRHVRFPIDYIDENYRKVEQ